MAAIVPDYVGATWTNGNHPLTGGTADVVITIDETGYSSNLPDWPPAREYETPEEELKAITRVLRREESLAACAWLSYQHHIDRGPVGRPGVAARPPRPTQRRTATATRNWRRPE